MKSLSRVLFILILQVGLMQTSDAISYGGLGGRPAFPREEEPRTESIFVHELEPGAVQEEGVYLINHNSEPVTALVYATDSTPSSDGAFACEQASEPKSDVGAWISFPEEESYLLEVGESLFVPFTIKVPELVDVGEHNGCIFVQEAINLDEAATPESSSGVQISTRMGMRVAITIPGELLVQLDDLAFSVDPVYSLYKVSARNTGNVSVDADITLRTVGLWGQLISEETSTYPVLREESASWQFPIKDHFWGGWFRSQVLVDYKSLNDPSLPVQSMVSPTMPYFLAPAPEALFIYAGTLLFFLLFTVFTALKLRRRARIRKTWKACKINSKKTLVDLAKAYGISWKLIARVNHLNPPYELKKHAKLLLPPIRRKSRRK